MNELNDEEIQSENGIENSDLQKRGSHKHKFGALTKSLAKSFFKFSKQKDSLLDVLMKELVDKPQDEYNNLKEDDVDVSSSWLPPYLMRARKRDQYGELDENDMPISLINLDWKMLMVIDWYLCEKEELT